MSQLPRALHTLGVAAVGAFVACTPPRLPAEDGRPAAIDDQPAVSQIVVPSPPPLQVAAASAKERGPAIAAGQTWKGSYVCGQGKTELLLEVVTVNDEQVEAIFRFHHRPSGARGAYHLSGPYQPDGQRLSLAAGPWIEQPPGYVTVDMSGTITKRRYAGRIENESCGAFSVVRQ